MYSVEIIVLFVVWSLLIAFEVCWEYYMRKSKISVWRKYQVYSSKYIVWWSHVLYYVTGNSPDNEHKAIAEHKAIVKWNHKETQEQVISLFL